MSERSKTDHFQAKSDNYLWGKDKKKLTIEPKTNGELLDLINDIQEEWDEAVDTKMEDEGFIAILREKPVKYIDKIVKEDFTKKDFLNGYPDDIYNLYRKFKDINFTFLKNLMQGGSMITNKIMKIVNQATRQKLKEKQNTENK